MFRGFDMKAHIKGLKEQQKSLEGIARECGASAEPGREVQAAVWRSVLYIEGKAKKNAPVDRGRLRASITPKVEQPFYDTVVGSVGTNVSYAPHLEFGTRPFWPPWEPIYRWALRVVQGDTKAAGALAHRARISIAAHGIKARQYLQKAFEDGTDRVHREIDRAVEAIASR